MKRALTIISTLRREMPNASTALRFTTPLDLLVATMLSAQCTDKRVNMVTDGLFKRYRKASDYAQARPAALEREIHSTGFFRNKARNIIACCKEIVAKHHGRVPRTLEGLVALPGVGRKTANVVLGHAFGEQAIPVDTHVKRVAVRLGLSARSDPDKIERDMMKLLPRDIWTESGNLLIWHGRLTCTARNPRCTDCVVFALCRWQNRIPDAGCRGTKHPLNF